MTLAQAQLLAHELTIIYIKQHPDIFGGVLNEIPQKVDLVADINRRFFDAIIHNKKFDGLY